MSVREWLNSVVKPTDAEDDERRWSADTDDDQSQRSPAQRKEAFRDRDPALRADPPRRWRDETPEGPRNHDQQSHGTQTLHRDDERELRRRDADQEEPQRQGRAGAGERGMRRRDRKRRFQKRAAEESRSSSFSGDEASVEPYRGGTERPRERGGEAAWAAREHDREPFHPGAPPADKGYGFDAYARPDSPSRELPKKWDADAEWRNATRAQVQAPPDDARTAMRESRVGRQDAPPLLDDYAARQEESRRLRDQQARLERQRRERELFERAAANAISEQRRQNLIDKAVAEIAARQQALDEERAIERARPGASESMRSSQPPAAAAAAAAPALRESSAAPREPERTYSPWPEGWRPPSAETAQSSPQERSSPPQEIASAVPEPSIDISGLQDQLREMTARIESLRPSSELEKAIVGLRGDLADIGRSFAEALPRRALETLETEVKSLGQRIDRSRQADRDSTALTGIEHGLAEVREALRGLTPMEGLAGFDGALKAISSKVEAVGAGSDPGAVRQLQTAVDELRGMITRVASDEALTKVAEDVRALSAKVDQVTDTPSNAPTLAALENRIDILASALNASTEAGHAVPRELEKLLSGLLEKLEWVQLTHTDRTALTHLEDRIAGLVRRLDASDARLGLLEGVERGLADLLIYIEQLRANGGAVSAARPSGLVAPSERSDALFGPSERSRPPERPQQSEQFRPIERAKPSEQFKKTDPIAGPSLHDDLFDDLEALSGIRTDDAQSRAPAEPSSLSSAAPMPTLSPAAAPLPRPQFADANEQHAGVAAIDATSTESAGRPGPIEPIDLPLGRPPAARTPIDPNLPPDHPLEPGSTGRSRVNPPLSEHVVPPETASAAKPPAIPESGGVKPDFIAAARRAAQAASAGAMQGKDAAAGSGGHPKKLSDRLRTLAVAAAVVVIVVGGFHIISRLFDDASGSSTHVDAPSASPPSQTEPPQGQSAPPAVQPEAPAARKEPPHVQLETLPSDTSNLLSPLPLSGEDNPRKSADAVETAGAIPSAGKAGARRDGKADNRAPETAAQSAGLPMDITGSVPNAPPPAARAEPSRPAPGVAAPAGAAITEKLPAAIGGPNLRLAAVAGDPLAAYEVGVRFSEGKGVPANNEEAARWFEIAAKKGIVPAQFRLGTLYEKGLGVKKDLFAARDLYRAAADRGHAKAMHNLAVIYAEGLDGKPDYTAAAQWFRKAADYGVTDSQYNLAILYARGVGVEQNLAESYKWFFLAAREGDQDAAQKRDEIGSRIDRTALAAARAAAESWTAIPQPAEATSVRGVWDPPQGGQPPAKPKPRSAKAAPRDVSRLN